MRTVSEPHEEGWSESECSETDPVEVVLAFARHIESLKGIKTAKKVCPACKQSFDPLSIRDRDRYLVTLILSTLADPNHHIGKRITKSIFKVWFERGGTVGVRGQLANSLREKDQFEFATQYLYDYGLPPKDIAMALGVNIYTVYRRIKYLKPGDAAPTEESGCTLSTPSVDNNPSE